MKLQSQISRKYGNSEYKKFWVVIPSKIIQSIDWKSGQELEVEIKDKGIILKKKPSRKT